MTTRLEPHEEAAILGRLVVARAEQEPDRLALIFENGELPDEPVDYQRLAIAANQIAWRLAQDDLRAGDRVAVMMRNHPEFVYALAANSKLGLITVPIDPRARADRLRYFLTFADCSALIVADYVLVDPTAADVIRETGIRTYVVSTAEGHASGLSSPGSYPSLDDALAGPERADVGQHVDSLGEPWLLSYTSGTTGNPKAIIFRYSRMPFYRLVPQFFGYGPEDVPYTGLSLIHGNALVATLMPALWGAVHHAVFSRWFTRTRLWDVCIKYGCTTWSNLGGIASAVYGEPPHPHDRAHKVRLVVSAGMPRELWEPFEQRFGVRILEWYGTMEGGFASNPPGGGVVGSFGKPPEGLVEMEVVDEADRPASPRQMGELVARPAGQAAVVEYYKNPDASAQKTRGGWLRTGDMCWRDEDGWFYFGFRKEEGGIRRLGEFVSEGFIRRVLLEDPDVLDVHVFGVPARSGAPGESDVVAAILVRDKNEVDIRALFERCANQLDRTHIPDYIQVVDELPKTATEKVQTRVLVQAFDASSSEVFSREQVTA